MRFFLLLRHVDKAKNGPHQAFGLNRPVIEQGPQNNLFLFQFLGDEKKKYKRILALEGSCSAVSKQNFVGQYSFCSIFWDLQHLRENMMICTLRTAPMIDNLFTKYLIYSGETNANIDQLLPNFGQPFAYVCQLSPTSENNCSYFDITYNIISTFWYICMV